MNYFNDAMAVLFGIEGGEANNQSDRGAHTMYGVTEAVAREDGYTGNMADLTPDRARSIFRRRYWDRSRCDDIAALSYPIAFELLDTGVNMGTGYAAKFLQRSLNALNREGKLYADIPVDCAIGPGTVAALSAFLASRGKQGETVMLRALNSLQGERYIEIAEHDKSQETFVFGWLANRVA